MSNENREHLLCAALGLFLRLGYRASVDAIAAEAGVSKQTLYNHFGSKEALFSAVVSEALRPVTVSLADASEDLREGLIRFAQAFRRTVLAPEAIALHRMLVAESPRFPEAAREVFLAGGGSMQRQLAATFDRAMRSGRLRRDDPDFAADMLISMLAGHDHIKLLFGIELEQEDPADRAQQIVDMFLHAFAPECGGLPQKTEHERT